MNMKFLPKSITYFFSAILLISALGHILSPELSSGFIPEFLPVTPVHIGAAIVEALLGIGLLIAPYRKRAFLGILLLMCGFLPLHIIDLFQETPVIGSSAAAVIRVVVQIVLIGMAWWGWNHSRRIQSGNS